MQDQERVLFVFPLEERVEFHDAVDCVEQLDNTAPSLWPSKMVFLDEGTTVDTLSYYAAARGVRS